MTTVVSRIDHFVITSADERALFAFFVEKLGLPVAWPMAQWGPIHEGGVCVGNCNIGCNHQIDPNGPAEATLAAIAWQPAGTTEEALRVLDGLGIGHFDPMPSPPLDLPDDPLVSPWSKGWIGAGVLTNPFSFLCEYKHDVEARRRADAQRLTESPNPVGIQGLAAVVVSTTAVNAWNSFAPTVGTAVRLVSGPVDAYDSLVFGVASIDVARAELAKVGVHVVGSDDAVWLDPGDALGLRIRLTDSLTASV